MNIIKRLVRANTSVPVVKAYLRAPQGEYYIDIYIQSTFKIKILDIWVITGHVHSSRKSGVPIGKSRAYSIQIPVSKFMPPHRIEIDYRRYQGCKHVTVDILDCREVRA